MLRYEAVVTFQSLDLESAEKAAELCRIYITAFEASRVLPPWVGEITTGAEVREYDDEDIEDEDMAYRVVPDLDFYGAFPHGRDA